MEGDSTLAVQVTGTVPFGHKVAVHSLGKGDDVVKYGASIRIATLDIHVGDYVHTHNLRSARW